MACKVSRDYALQVFFGIRHLTLLSLMNVAQPTLVKRRYSSVNPDRQTLRFALSHSFKKWFSPSVRYIVWSHASPG
jgi:hypothetical protein